jgi:hypothetical protein
MDNHIHNNDKLKNGMQKELDVLFDTLIKYYGAKFISHHLNSIKGEKPFSEILPHIKVFLGLTNEHIDEISKKASEESGRDIEVIKQSLPATLIPLLSGLNIDDKSSLYIKSKAEDIQSKAENDIQSAHCNKQNPPFRHL